MLALGLLLWLCTTLWSVCHMYCLQKKGQVETWTLSLGSDKLHKVSQFDGLKNCELFEGLTIPKPRRTEKRECLYHIGRNNMVNVLTSPSYIIIWWPSPLTSSYGDAFSSYIITFSIHISQSHHSKHRHTLLIGQYTYPILPDPSRTEIWGLWEVQVLK